MPTGLQIGIVGAGAIARSHHLPGLRELEGVEIVSVANRTLRSATAVAEQFGIPNVHPDWHQLVADPAVDGIVIGTWPDTHVTIASAAIEAGKHVLIEGRLALDHPQAAELLDLARRSPSSVVMVVPAAVTFWADRTVQRLLEEGAVGDLVAVQIDWGGEVARQQHPAWRRDRRRSGNNVMELGILVESIGRWVGFPVWVQADERIVETEAVGAEAAFVADVPDLLAWQGELPGGVLVRSLLSPLLPPAALGRRVLLSGNMGTLDVDLRDRTITLHRQGSRDGERVEPAPHEPMPWRVEAEFVGAIRGEEAVRFTDLRTAERYMAVTDAVRSAAHSGARTKVPEALNT